MVTRAAGKSRRSPNGIGIEDYHGAIARPRRRHGAGYERGFILFTTRTAVNTTKCKRVNVPLILRYPFDQQSQDYLSYIDKPRHQHASRLVYVLPASALSCRCCAVVVVVVVVRAIPRRKDSVAPRCNTQSNGRRTPVHFSRRERAVLIKPVEKGFRPSMSAWLSLLRMRVSCPYLSFSLAFCIGRKMSGVIVTLCSLVYRTE